MSAVIKQVRNDKDNKDFLGSIRQVLSDLHKSGLSIKLNNRNTSMQVEQANAFVARECTGERDADGDHCLYLEDGIEPLSDDQFPGCLFKATCTSEDGHGENLKIHAPYQVRFTMTIFTATINRPGVGQAPTSSNSAYDTTDGTPSQDVDAAYASIQLQIEQQFCDASLFVGHWSAQ